MSNPNRGPRSLSDILGELFTVRGYGRLWARQELENAWKTAVGEPYCRQTRLGEVRRGVLNVTVAHSALWKSWCHFAKRHCWRRCDLALRRRRFMTSGSALARLFLKSNRPA